MERSPSRPVRIGFDDLLRWSSRARLILSLLYNGLRRRAICGFTTIRPYVRFQPKHPHEVQAGAQELSDTRNPLSFGAILFFYALTDYWDTHFGPMRLEVGQTSMQSGSKAG